MDLKELEAVIKLPANKRYEYFIKKVAPKSIALEEHIEDWLPALKMMVTGCLFFGITRIARNKLINNNKSGKGCL